MSGRGLERTALAEQQQPKSATEPPEPISKIPEHLSEHEGEEMRVAGEGREGSQRGGVSETAQQDTQEQDNLAETEVSDGRSLRVDSLEVGYLTTQD